MNFDHQQDETGGLLGALLSLIGLIFLVALFSLLSSRCQGETIKLRWDANPEPDVTEYRVYRINGSDRTLLISTAGIRATVEASPGDTLVLTAFNGQESEQSDPLVVPVPQIVKVRLWRSTNLKDKTPVAEFYFPKQTAEFFSLSIETP